MTHENRLYRCRNKIKRCRMVTLASETASCTRCQPRTKIRSRCWALSAGTAGASELGPWTSARARATTSYECRRARRQRDTPPRTMRLDPLLWLHCSVSFVRYVNICCLLKWDPGSNDRLWERERLASFSFIVSSSLYHS